MAETLTRPKTNDMAQSSRIKELEAEIDKLCKTKAVSAFLARFSGWKIFPAESGDGYRLVRAGASGFDKPGGFFLSNLVLQGGGTLGLAHAGLIAGLERAGFRFPAVAGTSAGAIVVAGMVILRGTNLLAPTAAKLTNLIGEIPMDTFVDGPRAIRRVIKRFVTSRSLLPPLYWPGLWHSFRQIVRHRGLNNGHAFERWLTEVFSEQECEDADALTRMLDTIAENLRDAEVIGGPHPFNNTGEPLHGYDLCKVISAAMPTGTKFSLPRDLGKLHDEYEHLSPARMVRMSMSIPLFFEPVNMRTDPEKWPRFVKEQIAPFVSDRVAWEISELESLEFLDGGLFSNLPTDELVQNISNDIATISVPLVSTELSVSIQKDNSLSALVTDVGVVANAVRLQHDRSAHFPNFGQRPFNQKILKIDTGNAHWLNFTMSNAEKDELYIAGLRHAFDFLKEGSENV